MIYRILRDVALCAPLLAYAYYLVAAICSLKFSRRRLAQSGFSLPISILKPVCGVDREAFENFASFCRLDYPEYEILFGVADSADPAVPIIRKLIDDFPGIPISLFTPLPPLGANAKVSILAQLAPRAQHDLLIISDSDTRVDPGALRAMAAAFANERLGAASCVYRAEHPATFADGLETVGISTAFFPGVFTAVQFGGAKFALGALMAVRRAALRQIGGFEALSDYLLDDYELGRRVAASNARVELLNHPVIIVPPGGSVFDYMRREVRWAVGIRNSRPWGHLGLLVAQALPLTILAMAVSRSWRAAGAYLAAYIVTRGVPAWACGWMALRDRALASKWWLIPARDALGFACWAAGFFRSRVEWRGKTYRVRKGRLSSV